MMNVTSSDFYCTQCGHKNINVFRKKGRQREPGHLKRLYCFNCKEEHNHVEIKPFGSYTYEIFLIEFKMGNFNEDGTRKQTWKQCKAEYNRLLEKGVDVLCQES